MSARRHAPAPCPSWCMMPAGAHASSDSWNQEDASTVHEAVVDAWVPEHPEADGQILVGVRGYRRTSEVFASGHLQPGFEAGVGLGAPDARRLGQALTRAADVIEAAR